MIDLPLIELALAAVLAGAIVVSSARLARSLGVSCARHMKDNRKALLGLGDQLDAEA
jgi:uncharacterized integral membrane protein